MQAGVRVDQFRSVITRSRPGSPYMRDHAWASKPGRPFRAGCSRPTPRHRGPLWLGPTTSSETKKIIEAVSYAHSGELTTWGNGSTTPFGGCLIPATSTGSRIAVERALQPSTRGVQHRRPRPTPSGSEAGPGELRATRFCPTFAGAGHHNDFTNATRPSYVEPMHLARLLHRAGDSPRTGSAAEWDAGPRFDFANPEYRRLDRVNFG